MLMESGAPRESEAKNEEKNLLLEELDSALSPILVKINAWLASLEHTTYPIEEEPQQIFDIRLLVRRAGCELFYGDNCVQIRPVKQKTGNFFTVQLRRQGDSATVYAQKRMPLLTARPYTEPDATEKQKE